MVSYGELVKEGINRIYEEDLELQKTFISNICKDVREIEPDIIYKVKGIFIPNDEYLLKWFGTDAMSEEFDFYSVDGTCYWNNRLMLPITDLAGSIVGAVGFDPFKYLEAHETHDWTITYYTYSTKKIFNKGSYLFCLPDTYNQALEKGYLILTDGVFDTLAFAAAGYLSAAMMGSALTEIITMQLRFIPRIIIAMDNDEAGSKLAKRLKKVHNGVCILKQGETKDADDILKSEKREFYLKALEQCISNKLPLDTVVFREAKKLQSMALFQSSDETKG